MQAYEFIEGYGDVIACFGQWPDFHDGEVHRMVLDGMPRSTSGACAASLEIDIRGWIMGPEVTEKGYYVRHSNAVVSFRFEDVFDLALEGFNGQNVLTSLDLSLIEDATRGSVLCVEFEPCYLFDGEFKARRARVLGIAAVQ